MTRRTKFSCLLVVIAFIIIAITVGYLQYRRDRHRPKSTPFASLPSPSPLSNPQPISSPNEAQQPATASIAASVMVAETPTPTPCAYPTPLHDGWNAAAFGGERVGEGCWTVPVGMQAVIGPPDALAPASSYCKDTLPTFAQLPCMSIIENRSVYFHRCVKQVVDGQVIGGVRLVGDLSCQWEKERYQ